MPSGIYTHKPCSEETKEKIRIKNSGLKRSEETKEKIRQFNLKTGKIPPSRKGMKNSDEMRKKQSIGMIRNGHIPPSALGKKRSQEFKDKISKNHAHYWLGKKHPHTKEWNDKISYSNGIKKGWITSENIKIRTSPEYKQWLRLCMIRDNFFDQKTKEKGGKLEVHHINNFADFPELRFDVNNGITLSKKSHQLFHFLYGKKNNTREQLQEFLNK